MAEINLALNEIQIPPFTKEETLEKIQNLPSHIQCLSSQVAGHDYAIFQDTTTGYILKPIFDVRGIREEVFYKSLFDPKYDQDARLVKLRSFMPTYINTQTINEVSFVTLSDLTLNTINASLIDIKIGTITYDRNATEEKIANESTKDFLSRQLGFRVLALKKWIEDKNEYESIDRLTCRNSPVDEVKNIIKFFFEQPNKDKTKELIESLLSQMNEIVDWFEKENIGLFEFIGGSLLIIYSFKDNKLDCRVKMIDFAHIFPLEGSKVNHSDNKKDNNYLYGLNSLIAMIKSACD